MSGQSVELTRSDNQPAGKLKAGGIGAARVYGMVRSANKVTGGVGGTVFNPPAGEHIYGFHVILAAATNWAMQFVEDGSAVTAIDPAGFVAGGIYPYHLTQLTVPENAQVLIFTGAEEEGV